MLPRIVDGASRVLGIVGDPIAQVRSPPLWSALFRHNGMNAICVPFHIFAPALPAFVDGLRGVENLIGLLVTIPHKTAAARIADELTPRARKIGTSNLLRPMPDRKWEGDNLDGLGFTRALAAAGQRIAGRRALVVGAGGVGSAIAFALAEEGAAHVAIFDVDADRAGDLSRRIETDGGVGSSVVPPKAAGFDLVVNATPLGMKPGDNMPIDLTGLAPGSLVGDVVISETPTPLLRAAQTLGCHVQPGAAMTDHQVAAMAEFLGLSGGDWSVAAIQAALA